MIISILSASRVFKAQNSQALNVKVAIIRHLLVHQLIRGFRIHLRFIKDIQRATSIQKDLHRKMALNGSITISWSTSRRSQIGVTQMLLYRDANSSVVRNEVVDSRKVVKAR
jgi:hypothetical protein